MERWIIDTRFALRHLKSRPLYTALWIVTLALGVGGTAAIATIVSSFFLKPLPYPNEADLFTFWSPFDWSEAEHVALRPDYPAFQSVAAYTTGPMTIRQGEEPARLLQGVLSSVELFDVLDVQPHLGRTFSPGEDLHQGPPAVAVLSHRFWKEHRAKGASASDQAVGGFLGLDGKKVEIVGVMPEGFWFPDPTVDLWMTTPLDPENRSGNYAMIGRISEGTGTTELTAGIQQIANRLAESFEYPPEWDKTVNASAKPLREEFLGATRPALLATQAAMIAILLMAAANVGALMLGQLGNRSQDVSLRLALGAPRRRIAGQFFIEAAILGIVAGLAGTGIAIISFKILLSTMPLGPFETTVGAGPKLVVFAVLLALLTSFFIAMIPAFALFRTKQLGNVNGRGRGSLGERGGKLEGTLVVAEVAVAVLLVAAAGLLLRSTSNLRSIDTGIDINQVAALTVTAPSDVSNASQLQLVRRLQTSLSSLPGVESAAAVQRIPLSGGGWSTDLAIENREDLEGGSSYYRMVTEDYFTTMGIELITGRAFRRGDAASEETLVVINRSIADRYFADQDPLGRRISHGMRSGWARIIGVVDNEAVASLTDETVMTRYVLYDHVGFTPSSNGFVVRTKPGTPPSTVLTSARALIERSAPQVAIEETLPMDRLLTRSMGATHQLTRLLSLLSALALVLGMTGVYGVINHFVAKRSQEWSLRMALGLRPADILRLVLTRGAVLIVLGLVVGLLGARLLASTMARFLYGVVGTDPLVLLLACLALLVTGLLAAFLPAWRAGRSNPAMLLSKAP